MDDKDKEKYGLPIIMAFINLPIIILIIVVIVFLVVGSK